VVFFLGKAYELRVGYFLKWKTSKEFALLAYLLVG